MNDQDQNEAPDTEPAALDNHSLQEVGISGTQVHYFVLCPRKFWWFVHGIEQEHAGGASATVGQENVALGQLLHQESYPQIRNRDILIDDLLRLDFTEGGEVHEIKKSKGAIKATRMQLLYYLYYLKHEKGIETTGVIDFPKQRRRETVTLTPDAEEDVLDTLNEMKRVRELPVAPLVTDPMPLCRKCSYQELCWG